MARGQKTGGRQKGSRNRPRPPSKAVELIGDAIPEAFAGDAHAYLVGIYKDPRVERHAQLDAAKAALPYEKSRPVTITLANAGAEPLKVRSELEMSDDWRSCSS